MMKNSGPPSRVTWSCEHDRGAAVAWLAAVVWKQVRLKKGYGEKITPASSKPGPDKQTTMRSA